jgi:hypothetical protein
MLGLLAVAAPVPLVAVAAVLAGMGIEIFGVRWYTTMHEQEAQFKASSGPPTRSGYSPPATPSASATPSPASISAA